MRSRTLPRFSAVILAGGRSRRMGKDKAWMNWAGQPMVVRQLELVRPLGPVELFVSGRPEADYGGLGCPVLLDRFVDAGPLAGIERGLAVGSAPLLLVVAVDMPWLEEGFLRELLGRCTEERGVVPVWKGRVEPLVGVYPRNSHAWVVDLLEQGQRAVWRFVERCHQQGVVELWSVPFTAGRNLRNCNCPEDWAQARKAASRRMRA